MKEIVGWVMEENVAPDPSVAFACFISSCWWLPSGMFFLGLNVLEDLLLNKKLILLDLKIQNCISRVRSHYSFMSHLPSSSHKSNHVDTSNHV